MDHLSSYLKRLSEANKMDFEAKTVLLRLDLDVPVEKVTSNKLQVTRVADASRLEETLATVEFLLNRGAKIIAIGHLGRPQADFQSFDKLRTSFSIFNFQFRNNKHSLKTVYEWYKMKLNNNPNFRMLENLRFYAGEEENSAKFAKRLIAETGAEIYVFEAFAVSHREHASVAQMPKLLPTYAGMRFEKEIENLDKIFVNEQSGEIVTLALVMGGAKGETKIPLLNKLVNKFDVILVGGRMPLEVTRNKLQETSQKMEIKLAELQPDGLDITEESAREFAEIIKNAGVVVWNGPMGKFEEFSHEQGTKIVAKAMNETKAFTVAGGGDTEAALTKFNLEKGIDWISSGGGAMLTYLAEGTVAFLEVLKISKFKNMDRSKLAVSTYEKIAEVYAKEYFDDVVDIQYIDKLLEKLPKEARILDIGCGPGQFTKYMLDKGFQVISIDFSDEMLKIARKMVPDGKFQHADMRNLNFEDATFDGLLVSYSLIHIPSENIPKTLEGFYRILKPGGYVEIIAQKGEADKIVDEPFMPTEKMFFNFFTKDRLSDFLIKAGFKIDYQLETESLDSDSVSDKVIYTIARK